MFGHIDWYELSCDPSLSEEFMREHAEYLNWHHICSHKALSFSFLCDHVKYLYYVELQKNEQIQLTQEEKKDLQDRFLSYWKTQIQWKDPSALTSASMRFKVVLNQKSFPFITEYDHIEFALTSYTEENRMIITPYPYHKEDEEQLLLCDYDRLFSSSKEKVAFEMLLNHYLVRQQVTTEPQTFVSSDNLPF